MCRFTQLCRFLKQIGSFSLWLFFGFTFPRNPLPGFAFRCCFRQMHFHSRNQIVELNASFPNLRSHRFKDTLALWVLHALALLLCANLLVKTRQLAYAPLFRHIVFNKNIFLATAKNVTTQSWKEKLICRKLFIYSTYIF